MSEANAKRASIIAKAQKLRQMTTERGASEAEAISAIAALARLISEYNLSASELEIRADAKHCIRDGIVSLRSKEPAWEKLAIAIEKLYGTICWVEKAEEDFLGLGFDTATLTINYYGFPADVAGSITTLALCSIALDGAIAELGRRPKRVARESFEIGMTDRLRERIREMRSRRQGPAQGGGQLVLLKDQLVKDEFSKLGVKLYRSKMNNNPRDAASYAAGKRAGDGVALDARVSAQARMLGNG